jgi:UDPglucose--hexose-1-phosphate uridylyltransferase
VHTRSHLKADGRRLILYGREPHALPPLAEAEPIVAPHPHLRWHPLRGEWVIYATHRQERTFLPPVEFCPLCPTRPGGPPTEVPFADFEIAVFENRFPALVGQPPPPPELPVRTAPIEQGVRAACPAATFHRVQVRSGLNVDPDPL